MVLSIARSLHINKWQYLRRLVGCIGFCPVNTGLQPLFLDQKKLYIFFHYISEFNITAAIMAKLPKDPYDLRNANSETAA